MSQNSNEHQPHGIVLSVVGYFTQVICLVALLTLLGCDAGEAPRSWDRYPSKIETLAARSAPPDPRAESLDRGRTVYLHYCQICHGEYGAGDGFNSAMLDPPPRNFTDHAFWKQTADEQLVAVINVGGQAAGKSKLMPAWGRTLSEQQIRDVVAYLHLLPEEAKRAAAKAEAAEAN